MEALPVVKLTVPEVNVNAPERTIPLLLVPLMLMVPDVPVDTLAPIVILPLPAVQFSEMVPLPLMDSAVDIFKAAAELNVISPDVSTIVP